MFKAVANSPAALRMMWGAFGALGGGTLSPKVGEQIAVALANRNRCEYCLAAHTALGRQAGASAAEMARAQAGRSDDPAVARKGVVEGKRVAVRVDTGGRRRNKKNKE